MAHQVSQNHTRTCWVLKCDIRKFFANVDQEILLSILRRRIPDEKIIWLLRQVADSFQPGLPLGNLTSQLFANIYLNEFDQFVKHELKAKHYVRYADDFVMLSDDCQWLKTQLPLIKNFLSERLKLILHSDKICLKTVSSGLDFLGWIHFIDHRVLRSATRRRILRRLSDVDFSFATVISYCGLLGHGNTYGLKQDVIAVAR